MAEGIFTSDGKPVDVEAVKAGADVDFSAAMAAPVVGDEKTLPKRPVRDAEAPSKDKPRTVKRGRPVGSTSKPKPAEATPRPLATRQERRDAIAGVVQLGAAGCMLVGQRAPDPVPFAADAVVLSANAAPLAEAVADVCEKDAKFAAVVDKIAIAGPYGALITVTFALGSQIARNHGVGMPGTTDPRDIVKAAQAEQDMAQAA